MFRFESKSTLLLLRQMALAVFFVLLRGTQVLELEHSDHTTYLSGKDYQW